MIIKEALKTPNKGNGKNTCEYIILHHTGSENVKGTLSWFKNKTSQASAHYVVDHNGDIYKFEEDTTILWHAGVSSWKGKTYMNNYSIGIEIVGPGFSDKQRESVKYLILELSKKYNIPKENILRHKDIAPDRKIDVADSFRNNKFSSYEDYINSLFNNMSKYTKILEDEIKDSGVSPIFTSHEGDNPLTEQEVKELIDIAIIRLIDRLKK